MNKATVIVAYGAAAWVFVIALACGGVSVCNAIYHWYDDEFPYGNLCQSNFDQYKNTCKN